MNFTKIIILFSILISFSIPVNAQVVNGDFETGTLYGWFNTTYYDPRVEIIDGDYAARLRRSESGAYPPASIWQTMNTGSYTSIEFDVKETMRKDTWATIYLDDILFSNVNYRIQDGSTEWQHGIVNISGSSTVKVVFTSYGSNVNYDYRCWIDNVILTNYHDPPIILMKFTNEPIEVGTYAHLECNLDDYWNTHANEHFYLSYDYYYKNMSNYTVIDYNELELNAQNTVNLIPTYYPYFNQTGGCEIKASILYTYHDPIYNEEQLGGINYYISTILVNSTYEPPEEPEEPEEPEIPDPEPEPDPEPDPPIPPTQPNGTGVNQSINVSWTGEYYNTVNNTFGGLCSPIYNFTNWSLSPIYSLNNSIGEFNYHMNESFTQTAQDSSILYESINIIFGAIHPKIRNVITYYLIWVVLLIILKKD